MSALPAIRSPSNRGGNDALERAAWTTRSCWVFGWSALTVLGSMLAAASVSADGALPVSPIYLQASSASNGLQVRPATITYTGDGTGFIGGANARNRSSGIHWTKWTAQVALGTGYNQLNNCTPDCAGGAFHSYRVKVELWRPRTLAGRLVFTRMTIFYKKGRPRGEPRHYTFTDLYASGGYGWGPPDAQGYCVGTYNTTPARGCKNIHSLP